MQNDRLTSRWHTWNHRNVRSFPFQAGQIWTNPVIIRWVPKKGRSIWQAIQTPIRNFLSREPINPRQSCTVRGRYPSELLTYRKSSCTLSIPHCLSPVRVAREYSAQGESVCLPNRSKVVENKWPEGGEVTEIYWFGSCSSVLAMSFKGRSNWLLGTKNY